MSTSSKLKPLPAVHKNVSNRLFPVFLKLEELRLLIVGGGNVGYEKLNTVLQQAPACKIKLVATEISYAVRELAAQYDNVTLEEHIFLPEDLDNMDVVIVAVNYPFISNYIRDCAKEKRLLVNIADTPGLCDFYLGSIVSHGDLKIAISTNGKSPTIAKRIKEYLQEALNSDAHDLVNNMHQLRSRITGDMARKIAYLNELTQPLAYSAAAVQKKSERRWRRIASWCLFAFFFMFAGHLLLSYIPFGQLLFDGKRLLGGIDNSFYLMILAGFLAQLVDGALGMGYGVTCTIILLSVGIPLPAISGGIHTAEMFSSGASGFSHYKFGNVNKKLFVYMLAPGILGAVAGAWLLSRYGTHYASFIRPVLACYTFFLGVKIIRNVFRKNRKSRKIKHVGWLAALGGFLDSFGGGGWGPLVTSTLISKGKTPRYVIGTVSITEFFVTLASALTFFTLIGISHWPVIAGLIIGGLIAAPVAARLVGKLPLKTMFIGVGALVIFWSLNILIRTFL